MAELEPLLSPEDIAGLTGVNYHGVLRDIRSGKLKATRKGKGYRVEVAWYREWLEADIVSPARASRARAPARKLAGTGSVDDLTAIEREVQDAA